MNLTVVDVTDRLRDRSAPARTAYLTQLEATQVRGTARGRLACANLAHGLAAADGASRTALTSGKPNLAILTSYNDMLSAHQPFGTYPPVLKQAVAFAGGVAQVAGGVPAMCDGITQGRDGMELSLFSRDVIAMSAAIGLAHDMFDGALMLGVCDKIVPGLMIGALSFGHLPTVFVPAGPMTSGLPNAEKAAVRQRFAAGRAGHDELLAAETASYHSTGTCTFYGTANSNQLLMEVMGLHLPGSTFVNPGTELREAFTRAAAAQAVRITRPDSVTPIGELVDERTIVNACVALLASGGSTNHTMHLVAIARAAGIDLRWDDISELSAVVPLLCRVYPNGSADVNHLEAAGGIAFLIRTLLDAGLLHEDVRTVMGHGLRTYTSQAVLAEDGLGSTSRLPGIAWIDGPTDSGDETVLRSADRPFQADGGLRVLDGPLGRAVIKTSALQPQHRIVTAPALVFEGQAQLIAAYEDGLLDDRDFVAVVRYQGPAANGMPELHKLTPLLSNLQDRGQRVAIVTDGRMSGASGKVPAAIHVTPEAALGGPLARVHDGDLVTVDGERGILSTAVSDAELERRPPVGRPPLGAEWSGTGRELFSSFRAMVGTADTGASVFMDDPQEARHVQRV